MDIPQNPKKFPSIDADFGTSVATTLWKTAAQMIEYINQSYPVGMLMYFEADQSGLTEQPDPGYWKFMDGTSITNVASVFSGASFQNLRQKYTRHPKTGDTVLTTGGSDSVSFAHSHGGNTDATTDNGYLGIEAGPGTYQGAALTTPQPSALGQSHVHTIPSDLGSINIVPTSREVQVFMRVDQSDSTPVQSLGIPLFTPVNDTVATEGAIVSVETFQAISNAISYLMDSMPIGSIVPILSGFPGVSAPNVRIWQECDNSIITEPMSPMIGQHTPNMKTNALFVKGAPILGQSGDTGGSANKNLTHNHGGTAGTAENVTASSWAMSWSGNGISVFPDPDQAATITILTFLTITAQSIGLPGDNITIAVTSGGTAGHEVVTVVGNAISIQVQIGVSTFNQAVAAINANAAAHALVVASVAMNPIFGTTAVVSTQSATNLAGGSTKSYVAVYHTHGVENDLTSVNVEPAHYKVKYYVKIL